MNKLGVLILVSLLLISLAGAAELTTCPASSCPSEDNYCIFYFYGEECPQCAQVFPLISRMIADYPNFTFYSLEVWNNETNNKFQQDFISRYNIKVKGVPMLFIGSDALIGPAQITANLEDKIKYYSVNEPLCPLSYNKKETLPQELSPAKKIELTLPAIIAAAIVDSINPCAFAVLIFLLIYLTSMTGSKRVIKVGITYIITVFFVYFISGLGLLTVIQSLGFAMPIFYIAAVISLIAGLINIKDFFWYGKGITLAIPESQKPRIEKYIQKASFPAAIILGILVSMFELPCTGGVYLAILSLIAKNAYSHALPILLLYNLIFVLPLFVILLAVYFGFSAEKAETMRLKKRKWLRLIMGLVMLALGFAMILGWF